MSTSPFTLLEEPLCRTHKKIKLSILSFPPVNAPITDKPRAFDYTINAVHGHLDDYDYNELSSFLTGCIPGNYKLLYFGLKKTDELYHPFSIADYFASI
jgi:hypothetical protein